MKKRLIKLIARLYEIENKIVKELGALARWGEYCECEEIKESVCLIRGKDDYITNYCCECGGIIIP